MPIPDVSDRTLNELLSLSGRAIVVTGGARGIGAQVVRRLAEAGADVVVGDLDLAAAQMLATDVSTATGRKVIAVFMDVADTRTITSAADLARPPDRDGRLPCEPGARNAARLQPHVPHRWAGGAEHGRPAARRHTRDGR